MTDIVEFLAARLDEDQADAEAAHAGPWVTDLDDEVDENVTDASGQIVAWVRARPATAATRAHIARHDPARVLAEVKAKREIVAQHSGTHECPSPEEWQLGYNTDHVTEDECMTLRYLAAVDDQHSDYNPAWNVNAT